MLYLKTDDIYSKLRESNSSNSFYPYEIKFKGSLWHLKISSEGCNEACKSKHTKK